MEVKLLTNEVEQEIKEKKPKRKQNQRPKSMHLNNTFDNQK